MPWWLPFGRVPEVGAVELHEQLKQEQISQIVDVRSPWEWKQGHIKGARLVPVHTLKGRLPELHLDRSQPVVVICQTAHRSIPAVRLLAQAGYDARQLAGGMNSWQQARLPLESEG